MEVTLKMPDQVARQWGETPDAVGRRVMEDAAIEGYRAGRLSHRQVGEMLGLDYWQAEAFLKERAVLLNYSAAELEADNATIGLLEQAATRGLLELPQVIERLEQTNARLDPELIPGAIERDKARKQARQGGDD